MYVRVLSACVSMCVLTSPTAAHAAESVVAPFSLAPPGTVSVGLPNMRFFFLGSRLYLESSTWSTPVFASTAGLSARLTTNGSLEVRNGGGLVWSSGTAGVEGSQLIASTTAPHLRVRAPSGEVVHLLSGDVLQAPLRLRAGSSVDFNPSGTTHVRLTLRVSDGNLEVTSSGRVLWATSLPARDCRAVVCEARFENGNLELFRGDVRYFTTALPPLSGRVLRVGTKAPSISNERNVHGLGIPCSELRWNRTELSRIGTSSATQFGATTEVYSVNRLGWLMAKPASYYFPSTSTNPLWRNIGGVARSLDCGRTWTRLDERVMPLRLDGDYAANDSTFAANSIGNGVNHFATVPSADWFSQGFATHIDWSDLVGSNGRIYPVFKVGSSWVFQALDASGAPPAPIVGSANAERQDNLYSPAPVAEADGINLYFGGWRDTVAQTTGVCQGPSGVDVALYNGYVEEACTCVFSDIGVQIDACTGDKIFVATNRRSVTTSDNKLLYNVRGPGGAWVGPGNSAYFAPIVSPAKLNHGCVPLGASTETCPYALLHTNDPTVVKLPAPVSGRFTNYWGKPLAVPAFQYVMYFTGAIVAAYDEAQHLTTATHDFTHVAVSQDGLTWERFAILRHKDGPAFPGGQLENQANGTVRAQYDPGTRRIVLMSRATPGPRLPVGHADAWGHFVYAIDPVEPDRVVESRRVSVP